YTRAAGRMRLRLRLKGQLYTFELWGRKLSIFTYSIMRNGRISLGLVDDHQIVIDGLMSLLKGHERFQLSFATTDPAQVIEKMAESPIDILLTDVVMPQMTGNILAKQVKRRYPAVKILALSMSGQGDTVNEMINDADISGYVLKNIGKQEL